MTTLPVAVGVTALGVLAAGVAVAVWLRRAFLVVTVVGRSMTPTFEPGDRILARRAGLGRVRTGDVVVVGAADAPVSPGAHAWIIKRVAALPGDAVPRHRVPALAAVEDPTVPAGKMVLLGDSPVSSDSRQHGYFDGAWLVGRAVRRLPRR